MPPQTAKSRVPQVESYLFEILEVEPYNGFHLAYERLEPGAYGEHLHIELLTKCLRPRKFEGRETRFTFMGDRASSARSESCRAGGRSRMELAH